MQMRMEVEYSSRRLAWQEGQNPRALQENVNIFLNGVRFRTWFLSGIKGRGIKNIGSLFPHSRRLYNQEK
jgi:hypothetical protein